MHNGIQQMTHNHTTLFYSISLLKLLRIIHAVDYAVEFFLLRALHIKDVLSKSTAEEGRYTRRRRYGGLSPQASDRSRRLYA